MQAGMGRPFILSETLDDTDFVGLHLINQRAQRRKRKGNEGNQRNCAPSGRTEAPRTSAWDTNLHR